MAYKNLHLHNEIRRWTTEQLIETLEFNGLGECSDAIAKKQIDGEAFLNLSEGQLALWRNVLNTTQTRRLWSILQLAKERPQDFVKSNNEKSTPTRPALPTVARNTPLTKQSTPAKPAVPTVTRNTPLLPSILVKFDQPAPAMPTVARNTPLPPTAAEQMRNIGSSPAKLYDNLPPLRVVEPPTDRSPGVPPTRPPCPTFVTKPVKTEEPITTVNRKPFAASLNNLLSQQFAAKDDAQQVSPSSANAANYPLHKIQRKPSTSSIDSSTSIDSLPLPPKPRSRQPSPAPNETRSPTPNAYRPPPLPSGAVPPVSREISPNRSHLHAPVKFNTIQKSKPPPSLVKTESRIDHFATLPKSKVESRDSSDFHAPPLPNRPLEIFPSQTSTSQLAPVISSVNNYPNVAINTPPTFRKVPSPSWAGNRPLPGPPKNQQPYILQVKETSLPRPPSLVPIDIEVDYELPQENDDDAEYFFVDEVDLNAYKEQTWYKIVNRNEAKIILKGSQNGTFLVRPGKNDEHECSFSVMYKGRVYNIPVNKSVDKFIMGNAEFNTVMEIVDHFTANPLVLNSPSGKDIRVKLRKN